MNNIAAQNAHNNVQQNGNTESLVIFIPHMKPLHDGSAIYQNGSTWVCEHGVGYPDICEQCQQKVSPEIWNKIFYELQVDLILWHLLQYNR